MGPILCSWESQVTPTTSLSVVVAVIGKPVFGITAAVPISASRRAEKTTTGHSLFQGMLPMPPREEWAMYVI